MKNQSVNIVWLTVFCLPSIRTKFSKFLDHQGWFMIAFITCNSNLVPLFEGLCSSNPFRFEFSIFFELLLESNRRPRDWQSRALINWSSFTLSRKLQWFIARKLPWLHRWHRRACVCVCVVMEVARHAQNFERMSWVPNLHVSFFPLITRFCLIAYLNNPRFLTKYIWTVSNFCTKSQNHVFSRGKGIRKESNQKPSGDFGIDCRKTNFLCTPYDH